MKNHFLLAACLAFAFNVSGQHRTERQVATRVAEHKARAVFSQFTPFTPTEAPTFRDALVGPVVEAATFLTPSRTALAGLLAQPPDQLTLEIPTAEGLIALDLVRAEIHTSGFSLVTASTGAPVDHASGAHYRGTIAGDPNTLAAISIFADEVMGFVSDATGNHVLGKLEGSSDEHVYYAERDLIDPPAFECHTTDEGEVHPDRPVGGQDLARTARCVALYWEVDHDIFLDKGDITNTTNFITGLFNQHATLFDNDGISVVLSELFIWDVPSPYTGSTSSFLLNEFRFFNNGYNGDVGHLLDYSQDGGRASFDGLCNSDPDNRLCYSGIDDDYLGLPIYSWSVTVVTHEEGHVMGSRHTHACVWNGNNTAIDNCGPNGGFPYEGNCNGAPVPVNGGTVMSYCHLTPAGINFANGFGPQPTALIIDKVNTAECLSSCGSAGCDMPVAISNNALANSATISWEAVDNATSYTLQWKPSGTANWNTVAGITGTDHVVDGLLAAVTYGFRVRSECAGGSSPYSPVDTLTTPCTLGAVCQDGDPLTENDIVFTDCDCSGTPRRPFEEINKIVASDRSINALFGTSVSISGDYAIVGALIGEGDGAAYIYVKSGNTWIEQQELQGVDVSGGDQFGCSVAIEGDYAVVGANMEDRDAAGGTPASDAGCAYIFKREGDVWIEQQKVVANDRAALDEFGWSVAISGDHVIVGARYEDHDAVGGGELDNSGSAYIFVRNGDTWMQQAKLVATDRDIADGFGWSVAISGDHAIVGARSENDDAMGGGFLNLAGSAYIFARSGDTWTQQTKLVPNDRSAGDEFGTRVSISGDHAIVGAPKDDEYIAGVNFTGNAGSAYIFAQRGGTWIQQKKLLSNDIDGGDEFGISVAINGDRVVVGEHYEDRDATGGAAMNNAGAAYIFVREGDDWGLQQKLVASDRALVDVFGTSVAISSDHVIVGATREDEDVFGNNTINQSGSAYLFTEVQGDIPTGLDPINITPALFVYPVPTRDVLNVMLPDARAYRAGVIGLDGRSVLPAGILYRGDLMDVSTLAAGAYLLRITTEDHEVHHVRFVKE